MFIFHITRYTTTVSTVMILLFHDFLHDYFIIYMIFMIIYMILLKVNKNRPILFSYINGYNSSIMNDIPVAK